MARDHDPIPPHPRPMLDQPRSRTVPVLLAAIFVTLVIILAVLLFAVVGTQQSESVPAETARRTPAPGDERPAASSPVPASAPSPVTTTTRSPIPQPGENITQAIPPTRLADALPPRRLPAEAVIRWNDAHHHVGQTVTVEGRVVETHNTGSVCFLNFARDRRGFYVIIFSEALGGFPEPPETYFLNRTVRATGQIHMRSERPQIRVTDPQQLELID